jgi:hypothetical protein
VAALVGLYSPVMGSGKTSVAEALAGHKYRTVKFAGPLKTMLRTLLALRGASVPVIDRMIEGDLKEVPTGFLDGRTPRHAMQTLGTEWGRECMDENFWVNSAMAQVDTLMAQGTNVVMDDVRFINEAYAIRERGGLLVRIVRPPIPQVNPFIHKSEMGLDVLEFDLELVNDKPTLIQWQLDACHEIAVKQFPDGAVRNL